MSSQHSGTVLVVGDANVDLIVPFPVVRTDGSVRPLMPELHGGGTAANTAVALGKLDVPTSFMGTIGGDDFGRLVLADFDRVGIRTEHLVVDPALNTVCVYALIDRSGERHLWGWPRERQAFAELEQDRIDWRAVEESAWVHTSGMALAYESTGRHAVIEILRRAHALGIPTSLDLNLRLRGAPLDPEHRRALLDAMEHCTYVLGSGDEEFAGLYPDEDWRLSVEQAVRADRIAVARMGAAGALASTLDGRIDVPAFSAQVVDTVGAGDAFNAGFIAARLQGLPIAESLRWGNAASAHTIAGPSARSSPSRHELLRLLVPGGEA